MAANHRTLRPVIYITHPLAGGPPGAPEPHPLEANFKRYMRVCAAAIQEDFAVISWAHHYLAFRDFGCENLPHETFLEMDLNLLFNADALVIGGPLTHSRGSQREVAYAVEREIPTHTLMGETDEEFREFFRKLRRRI
jgi:nucleoside 2-deoxyribosyltransferase